MLQTNKFREDKFSRALIILNKTGRKLVYIYIYIYIKEKFELLRLKYLFTTNLFRMANFSLPHSSGE
jgi:hypothetical protein